jgi:hypothetical protein
MTAVATFAVLASLLSGPKIPDTTKAIPVAPAKEQRAGTLTVKMSSGFGTTNVKVQSELMTSALGELGMQVTIGAMETRLSTTPLGKTSSKHSQAGWTEVGVYVGARPSDPIAARIEAQIGRCAVLAKQPPPFEFTMTVLLAPEEFARVRKLARSRVAGEPLHIVVDASAIQQFVCMGR